VPGSDRTSHNKRIARLGGLAFSASHDGRQATEKARRAFADSFVARVRERFPELTDEAEIRRRAEAQRKLHYAELAYKSALARARRRR
jgi:hypothetical protein